MLSYVEKLNVHYGRDNLSASLLAALEQAGKNVNALTRDDLAGFEEFHIRGRDATRELAQMAGLQEDWQVLDIGSGLGGPARTLAAEFGARVSGIDVVEEYHRTAEMLTGRVNLDDRVRFYLGDILDMPFHDDSFDAVWSQHITMNIADKLRLLEQVHRVLRPGGKYVFYEIFAGQSGEPYLPVPWTEDASLNFLVTAEELKRLLRDANFEIETWKDVSQPSLTWFRGMMTNMAERPADSPPPLGLNLLMGAGTKEKVVNTLRNLEEKRIEVHQGVAVAR